MEDLVSDSGDDIIYANDEILLELFFSKLSTIYGLTGGGKSYVTNTILESLQSITPKFLIYSKTEEENKEYTKETETGLTKAPITCVSTKLEVDQLKKVLELQKGIKGLWWEANDLIVLKRLFDKVCTRRSKQEYERIEEKINSEDDGSDKFQKTAHFKKARAMKNYITKDYQGVGMNSDDVVIFNRFDTNPNLGIVIDDFAGEISDSSGSKHKGKPFWETLSYNIRHANASVIVMSQDINMWPPTIRKNVHTNVFTSLDDARNFFKGGSMGFSRELQYQAESVIRKLNELGEHRILIYSRKGQSKHMFYYIIGKTKTDVKLGSNSVYKMDERIAEKNRTKKTENKYINEIL